MKALISIIVALLFAGLGCKAPIEPTTVSADSAIQTLQNQYPELKQYPSEQLPPKSIKTESTDEGWYVAFVQEGSGVPIIDARCFLVRNDNSIVPLEFVASADQLAGDFSAKECRIIGNIVGRDRDEHGCIGSAGYSWCEAKQKCLRVWEEPCTDSTGGSRCEVENCHGMDIVCGPNPPDACTAMYAIGDKCLQYAQCGMMNGECQQIGNPQFTQCKSCIQACIDTHKDDAMKQFECESECN
ncbi:MAG: hypothetical protein V1738_00210 [Patescibacteria group bacterium]